MSERSFVVLFSRFEVTPRGVVLHLKAAPSQADRATAFSRWASLREGDFAVRLVAPGKPGIAWRARMTGFTANARGFAITLLLQRGMDLGAVDGLVDNRLAFEYRVPEGEQGAAQ